LQLRRGHLPNALPGKAELGKGGEPMNWKSEATEKLRQYDAMRKAACNIPKEIQRLRVAATAIRGVSTDATPVKGSSRREEMLINNLVHRQELQWTLEQTKCWLDVTERALSCLTQEEKLILHRLYISPEKGGLERLCQELDMEKSTVYRRRDRALQRFAMALYGLPKTWQAS